VRERRDDCRGELDQAAAAPDQHREGAHLQALGASDASDAALRDATDAADLRPEPGDAGVEKLVVPALDARGRVASSLSPQERLSVQPGRSDAAAELCRQDAVRFAEQSCAAREAATDPPVARAVVPRWEPEAPSMV
jgi:hypothetical protein